MGNMSYCRFENTSEDLRDCVNNWHEKENLSDYEIQGRQLLVRKAIELIDMAKFDDEFESIFNDQSDIEYRRLKALKASA